MKKKKILRFCFQFLAVMILFGPTLLQAQEKFIDVRQKMADKLTEVKVQTQAGNWEKAEVILAEASATWNTEVKPLILEGVKKDSQFQEYYNRISEVENELNKISQGIQSQDFEKVITSVNATIWAISHHPRGFDVPPPRYTVWDWVFALTIGLGFCIFAIWFGLYLRRSYYRRFPKATFIGRSKT